VVIKEVSEKRGVWGGGGGGGTPRCCRPSTFVSSMSMSQRCSFCGILQEEQL